MRWAGVALGLAGLAVLVGTVSPDPVRQAWLMTVAQAQARTADDGLAEVERILRMATDEARAGQAAILSGDEDPALAMTRAGAAFESTAGPVDQAHFLLDQLGWTLQALDPGGAPPGLELTSSDVRNVGAQWRATALPSSALADVRRQTEAVLAALEDALQGLDVGDAQVALDALDRAEAALGPLRQVEGMPILVIWIDTVEALADATRAIALAAAGGDAEALADARAAYVAATGDAHRADQALTIALAEGAARITGPATISAAAALREAVSARDALAALSILR